MEIKITYNPTPPFDPLVPPPPPGGWFLAQAVEDNELYGKPRSCATKGCPSFYMILDDPDTWFDQHHQLALYAHNFPMPKNNVASLMGAEKVLLNGTGISDATNRKNWISDKYPTPENPPEGDANPRLDKLRTFIRNTHWVRVYDKKYYQIWTMDGRKAPPMKPGTYRPRSALDIESRRTKSTDYVYNPYETLPAFMVPNNIKTKIGGYSVYPFAHGLVTPWMPEPEDIYTFFPLVSEQKVVVVERRFWKPVQRIGNYYRRFP